MWAPARHGLAALTAVAAAPVALVAAASGARWRTGWPERLGRAPLLPPGAVWVHGASVGEIQAALSLIDALREREIAVLASTMTLTGRSVIRRARPDLPSTLAPLDHPWSAARALARVRPRTLVLIETELWPAWIAAAARQQVPVLLASARLSDRGFARYRRLAPLLRSTLRRLARVGARSQEDADRFVQLGVPESRVRVTGDLKLEPPGTPSPLARDLALVLEGKASWVAASTHPGEETAVLEALDAVERAGIVATLVLAPRHPERAAAVVALARDRGRAVRLRSALGETPLRAGEVLLIDSVGELPAVLSHASLVFVGGSLTAIGGHNLVEPAWCGKPVLVGPHTENWREVCARLLACGSALRVANAGQLSDTVTCLFQNPDQAKRRGEAGRLEVERHRGATERTLAWFEPFLSRRGEAACRS